MEDDPIVAEVRRVRDEHARKFNYDLDAIVRDLQEQEKKSGIKFKNYPAHRVTPVSVSRGSADEGKV